MSLNTCLLLLLVFNLRPQEEAEAEAARIAGQIRKIDVRVNGLTDKLDALSHGTQKLSDEVGRLELKKALIQSKVEKHELELAEADQKIQANTLRQKELKKASTQQRERIGTRLRQLYKRGKLGHSQILLKQSRLVELINAYHYARVLTRRDNEVLAEYLATIDELNAVNLRLTEIQATAEEARADLARERAALQLLLDERARKLKKIRKEAQQKERLLQELELEKDEMMMMVRRMVDRDADPMTLRVPISRYKGRLPWPAKGRVRRQFGIYRDPEFNTRQRQNGMDISIPLGTPVKTVYSGRVLFADWFKSYGNVIIVDHGEKIISFYAHLQSIDVEKGQFLERDVVLGKSGDTGSLDGAMLHFEVRHKTEPVDPREWLK